MKKLLKNPLIKSILFWVIFTLSLFVSYFLGSFLPQPIRPYALGIFGTLFAFAITYGVLRIDKKSFSDIGLVWQGKTFLRFIVGFIAGSISLSLIVAAIVGFTPMKLSVEPTIDLWDVLLLSSLALIPQAWMEEIAFRAYPLVTLQKSHGIRFAIYIGAVAFALYHYIPGGNLLGSFLGTGIWAVAFGVMAVWTKGIAFPTGFHFGLNLLQAVFGMKEPYPPIARIVEGESESSFFSFEMDQIGLACQILVLLISVLLMEVYIRNHSIKTKNQL